ncbi:hypothetical protein CONLIGDRAFT_687669 [Coniochaeta ligniaria NRRL 30616]|uniref:Major facilitator superfamily (MFS) profile domain-containing protein n=1 Tax=Coniochaeta ligniaria NRRL 30616 TaxID=1408157 RepID=A0A1J7I3U9_9PEZI|nr:hypothetical protein CONLIGDRAFT_687669 [Coniochaeta ligniaria NRRL 30616]
MQRVLAINRFTGVDERSSIGTPDHPLTTFRQALLNLGNSAISVVGTILAWPMLAYLGRRTIFLNGLLLMTILYFAIGFASIATNSAAAWAQSCLLIGFLFVYSPSVAATIYAIVGEVGASEPRGKTVSLARATAYLVDIV